MPSYVPGGGLNAIQEDTEMEESQSQKESESSVENHKSAAHRTPVAEPQALSTDEINILSETIRTSGMTDVW